MNYYPIDTNTRQATTPVALSYIFLFCRVQVDLGDNLSEELAKMRENADKLDGMMALMFEFIAEHCGGRRSVGEGEGALSPARGAELQVREPTRTQNSLSATNLVSEYCGGRRSVGEDIYVHTCVCIYIYIHKYIKKYTYIHIYIYI